jgi:hypothetical protein
MLFDGVNDDDLIKVVRLQGVLTLSALLLYSSLTIVDALDTLWIMDLKDEFRAGQEWVRTSLSFNKVLPRLS